MFRIIAALMITLYAMSAHAQLAPEERTNLLSFYPCAVALNDDELAYLKEWANATKTDPCGLTAQDFADSFIQDAPQDGEDTLPILQTFFEANKPQLFVMQVLLFGRKAADGLWGPMTEERMSELLEMYHAIGGINDDWGIRTIADVPRFLEWVAAAEFAIAVSGEFPD